MPLRNVDWFSCSSNRKLLAEAGARRRQGLDSGRNSCCDRNALPSIPEVLDIELGEVPGAGICAKPGICKIESIMGYPPNNDRKMVIRLQAPRNCRAAKIDMPQFTMKGRDANVVVWDESFSSEKLKLISRSERPKESGKHYVEIEIPSELNRLINGENWTALEIEAEWRNEFYSETFTDAWQRPEA